MSGHQGSSSNTYSHLGRPNIESFKGRTPAWSHYPNLSGANSFKRPRTPSGLEYSSYNSPSEKPYNLCSPKLPVRRICMGRPYNSKCVETSHLMNYSREVRKPAGHSLPCTDRPSVTPNPTFLDQIIKGINYLDRSTNAFCTKSSLSLPRLAANYLEQAANSICLDQQDHPYPPSYSHTSTSTAASHTSQHSTCMVQSTRNGSALQGMDDATNMSSPLRLYSRNLTPQLPQRPGIKLPELPLFGNGIFSLGRLPKFWEAIRSGWRAPELTSKPCNWW
ncbi:uncharacterized protein LOC119236258 [Talpa occidentalis]|uniref:uncharacterized protein LOC119236258 n=1 Tax=Talpa occidentalis TaxID=50954 RepID=UPI00188E3346|nr:uncharacterized protein LOC119236258 [Talpa occidentalis]XP_037355896.1 uncharacterized protein LOC119236258 [Talpa occidentalis]